MRVCEGAAPELSFSSGTESTEMILTQLVRQNWADASPHCASPRMQTSKTAGSSLHIQMAVLRQSPVAATGCEPVAALPVWVVSQAQAARFDDECRLAGLVLLTCYSACADHARRGLDATSMLLDGALSNNLLKDVLPCL